MLYCTLLKNITPFYRILYTCTNVLDHKIHGCITPKIAYRMSLLNLQKVRNKLRKLINVINFHTLQNYVALPISHCTWLHHWHYSWGKKIQCKLWKYGVSRLVTRLWMSLSDTHSCRTSGMDATYVRLSISRLPKQTENPRGRVSLFAGSGQSAFN